MKSPKIFIYTYPELDGDIEHSYITNWHLTAKTRPITTIIFPDNNPIKKLDIIDLRCDRHSGFLKELDLLEL